MKKRKGKISKKKVQNEASLADLQAQNATLRASLLAYELKAMGSRDDVHSTSESESSADSDVKKKKRKHPAILLRDFSKK